MGLRKSSTNSVKKENVFLNAPLENICVRWESKPNGLNLGLLPLVIQISANNCIMDLFSRKIITWTLADTLDVSTVISTIDKAKASRDSDLPLIIHTDRGYQYVSEARCQATERMTRSYSHTGYPYDNACIESFHSLIKREWLNRFAIKNDKHAYSLVFEYIETFYSTIRIHSHCDHMSPNDYEKLYMRVDHLPAA